MYFVLVYLALQVAFYFAQRADAAVSEEGFKRGYGEGNELIVKLFGDKPAYDKLVYFNYGQLLVFSLPAVFFASYVFKGWVIAATLAIAGKHMMAVRRWRRAFATNGQSLQEGQSAWQKFLGL